MKQFLFCLALALLLPAMAMAEATVTLRKQSATLESVISAIEQQTDYLFIVNDKVDAKQRVSLDVQNASLTDALKALETACPVHYELEGKHIILTAAATAGTSKQVRVNGVVRDETGEPVVGAAIAVEGTTVGTVTDLDGQFELDAPLGSVLEVTYIGYVSQKLPVQRAGSMVVNMAEDRKALEEVVVIGYGTIRKSDLTGSVASVKTEELNQTTGTFEQALVGHTPGVEIKQTSGAPGASATIHIRGVNSIYSGVEPLYVIDGFPASKDVYINPSDVESIDVLKDAASAAIYGSRASGGVVLITTKRGKEDGARVQLDYQFSMQQVQKKIKMMNADQLRELHEDGYNNAYFDYLRTNNKYATDEENWQHSRTDDNATRIAQGAGTNMLLCPDFYSEYDTDWQDAIFSNAPMHKLNMSVSGGKGKSKYMFSLGYLNQDGIVSPGNHQRLTARLNMDFDVTKRFSIGVNSNMYYVKERKVRTDGLSFNDGVILSALGAPPMYAIYDENGNYITGQAYKNSLAYNTFSGENAVAIANERQEYYTRMRYSINTNMQYTFLDGFFAKVNAGVQIADQLYSLYRPSTLSKSNEFDAGDFKNTAVVAKDNRDFNTDWLLEATLNYNKTLAGKHTVNALVGYSMQKKNYNNIDANSVTGAFQTDRIPELSAAQATETDENGTLAVSDKMSWALMSAFARAMYSYDSRYTLSLTLRADGCSRFGANNRWGFFPSVSGGWNITNEPWAQSAQRYVVAKLRASWGISGNNNIGNYYHIATIKTGSYSFGGATVSTYYPRTADSGLGWEKTQQTNIGVDLSFFSGRLNLISNYYYSLTTDLLCQSTTSALIGWTSMWTNLKDGRVRNTGADFQVDGNILQMNGVRWNMGFNISFNRNRVDGLNEEIMIAGQRSQITHITRNGAPIGSFFGMVHEGLISEDDYALIKEDAKHQGESGYVRKGPAVADYTNVYVGDVKWKDVNGDGVITEDDRDIIGDNYPKFSFGLTTSVSWKGLNFSATFDGQYGASVINFSRYYLCNNEGGGNAMIQSVNRYRDASTEVDENTMYRANRSAKNLNTKFSDFFVEDASFFRCTNMMLGYNIPKNKVFDRMKLTNMNIFFSVDNVFTATKYSGYNPDVDYNDNVMAPGIDFGTYPLSRVFSGGVKLTF